MIMIGYRQPLTLKHCLKRTNSSSSLLMRLTRINRRQEAQTTKKHKISKASPIKLLTTLSFSPCSSS